MVQPGIDVLFENTASLKGKKIALLCNYTAVTSRLTCLWEELIARGIGLEVIFSPEHGLFGTEQDQVGVTRQADAPVPVKSLYGNDAGSLVPADEDLKGIDCIIFDIQDVGARYYTYVNSMIYVMRQVSGRDISFMVLDRPNPLGGDIVEGTVLKQGYESFVGVLPVPVRHGMTAGEMARMAKDIFRIDIDLTVIAMRGWERWMQYPDTGMTWIHPSPNLPDYETALLYPGLCLMEGMNVSEGRGTTLPFKLVGASFIESDSLAAALNGLALPGIYFRPHHFKPQFNKYAGTDIRGVHLHVLDRSGFKPFKTGVALASVLYNLYKDCTFLRGVYEFNDEHPAFDLLAGGSDIRFLVESGAGIEDIEKIWQREESDFGQVKQKYHLY